MSLADFPARGKYRPNPPSHAVIADAWASLDLDEFTATLPNHRALAIGWGEPMCFRCGWLAPVRDVDAYPDNWKRERRWDFAWNGAGAWLEKGHLHDYAHGGSNDPLNFVLMCVLCHEQQGSCSTREAGLAFVNEPTPHPWMLQMFTDARHFDRKQKPSGSAQALHWMLRAQAAVAKVGIQAIEAQFEDAA